MLQASTVSRASRHITGLRGFSRLRRPASRARFAFGSTRGVCRWLEGNSARTPAEREAGEAMLTLVRLGWGQENSAFRQLFTSQFMPGGTKEQSDWFNELQRISTSSADAARNLSATGEADVSSLLSQVKVPTLVIHARHDARVPFEIGTAISRRNSGSPLRSA